MIHALYAASGGDAAITWICPEDTEITDIKYCLEVGGPVDNASTRVEVSFAATSQFTSNDVANVIDALYTRFEAGAAGTANCYVNHHQPIPGGVQVEAGEKVYVHVSNSNASYAIRLFIHTKARRTNKSSFRRRS